MIGAQKIMYPDVLELMRKRYTVLYTISIFEPIGRRGLIDHTDYPERFIRNETELLKQQDLIRMTAKGMYITETGKTILHDLYDFNRELLGIATLEKELKQIVGANKVIVVPGDSDQTDFAKRE